MKIHRPGLSGELAARTWDRPKEPAQPPQPPRATQNIDVYGPEINFLSQPVKQSFKRIVAQPTCSDKFHSCFLGDSSPKRPFWFPCLGKPLATLFGSVSLQLPHGPRTLKPKPFKNPLILDCPKHVTWPPWLRLTDGAPALRTFSWKSYAVFFWRVKRVDEVPSTSGHSNKVDTDGRFRQSAAAVLQW